ncbi:MAG TPA: hypothetical protein VGM54_02865 [Chthoniobacter sp.]|jgi:hypothetical protein
MKKRVTHINPLQLGKTLGGVYFALSLIVMPIIAVAMVLSHSIGMLEGLFLAIGGPIIYGILGMIVWAIMGAIYNLLARWTGGIEVTVEDVPPAI